MNKNYNMSQIAQLSAEKDNEIKVEIGGGMEITVNTCLSLEEKRKNQNQKRRRCMQDLMQKKLQNLSLMNI